MVQIQWKNMYNFFSDKEDKVYPNYLKYFNSFGTKPLNPTIFIFDNEISSKRDKSVKKFIYYVYKGNSQLRQKNEIIRR